MSPLERLGTTPNVRDFQLDLSRPPGNGCDPAPWSEARAVIEEQVARIWKRLEQSERVGVSLGEETLTDLLLLEIAVSGSREIAFWKASKPEEALYGLDWEWWIGSDRLGWLRYAVQAKRVDANGYYSAVGHQVAGQPQIEILERYAAKHGAVPLYCFYNHQPVADAGPFWNCGLETEMQQLGATVVPLSTVRSELFTRKRPSRRRFDWLHREGGARPMRCLTCCPWILACAAAPGEPRHPLAESFVRYDRIPDEVRRRLASRRREAAPGHAEPPDESYAADGLILQPKRILAIDVGEVELSRRDAAEVPPLPMPVLREH